MFILTKIITKLSAQDPSMTSNNDSRRLAKFRGYRESITVKPITSLQRKIGIWVCGLILGFVLSQTHAYCAAAGDRIISAITNPPQPPPTPTQVGPDFELSQIPLPNPFETASNSPQANQPSHQREFRGVWVASVVNIDWPSASNLSVAQQKSELLAILNRMQELNLNALVLQIRPTGDAFYQSQIEPWSTWLTGRQGQAPNPFYDPLQFAVEESHKRNIELHAWFNPYRARMGSERGPFAPNHMAAVYPQYAYRYGDLIWMDPGAKEVQDRTYNVIMDVVRRYDIDAVHLDDYFYPYPKPGIAFPDGQTYNAYRAAGGNLSLADWRRNNVNQMIFRLYQGIKEVKPYVKFGISPFGIYRPGKAPGIVGMDQYEAIFADVKLWMDRGWLDYLSPQLYWRIDPPQQSYPVLLDWWVRNNPFQRHIYTGNFLSQLANGWPVSEFQRQVQISRQKANQLSLGNIFFSMKMFRDNQSGVNEVFKSSVYPTPALPPSMPWLDNEPPQPPTGLQAASGMISWNPSPDNDIRSWALYQQFTNGWQLVRVIDRNTTAVSVSPGTYALRAVDRMANESSEAIVNVS
ncbi:family 10 glycosylhydrolase [Limnospira sp. PMC 289.06]|uniref:glycoside hydrolase family 10 protein n=1 Tax=Limnospira sp. PMC 289.06 TaxID=2981094 RepID=UPI0028E149B7|nr:family 10 glycosylhydrolase [Limnospira sp. PMC 289.06]